MYKKYLNKQLVIGVIAGVLACSLIALVLYSKEKASWLPESEVVKSAETYINSNLIQSGKVTVKVLGKESGMYKLEVDYNGQKISSLMSKDGKKFSPQVMDVTDDKTAKNTESAKEDNAQPAASNITEKSDKPKVELFVMSHCPYGLQMEKGILPAVKALAGKIDFKVKFNDYAMHGEKELKQELSQYCIQEEQNDKYLAYLECFTKNGDTGIESCLDEAKIDRKKMNACVTKADQKYKVLENFNNKEGYKGSYPGFDIFKADNEKYNVGGSPTLIINGIESQSGRDSKSLLASICSAFNNQPKECGTELSGSAPTSGFGVGTQSGSTGNGGGCGN